MIFEARKETLEAGGAVNEALDRLTPEQVEQKKYAIWSKPESLALEAAVGKVRIVAEGDSWFDYLPGIDILDHLSDMGHAVIKVAKAGDTLENMVYGTLYDRNFARRPNPLEQTLALLRSEKARFLLFSGGGNDVSGEELEAYLNHKDMNLGAIRTQYADYVFGTVIRDAYRNLIDRVRSEVGPDVHIISHGYANPIPDGRAVINIPWGWHFFGPWLRPALTKKNYVDDQERRGIMRDLVSRFNTTLRDMADDPALRNRFHYLDLRPLISDDQWVNELHLKSSAYGVVAMEFDRVIRSVPN